MQIESFVNGWKLGDVLLGEFEQGGGGFEPILLKVNEGAGELNQAFVEMIIGLAALTKPEFLQDIVRFVEELFVEAFEIAKVMRIKALAFQRLDHFGDARAFLAHAGSIGAR